MSKTCLPSAVVSVSAPARAANELATSAADDRSQPVRSTSPTDVPALTEALDARDHHVAVLQEARRRAGRTDAAGGARGGPITRLERGECRDGRHDLAAVEQ